VTVVSVGRVAYDPYDVGGDPLTLSREVARGSDGEEEVASSIGEEEEEEKQEAASEEEEEEENEEGRVCVDAPRVATPHAALREALLDAFAEAASDSDADETMYYDSEDSDRVTPPLWIADRPTPPPTPSPPPTTLSPPTSTSPPPRLPRGGRIPSTPPSPSLLPDRPPTPPSASPPPLASPTPPPSPPSPSPTPPPLSTAPFRCPRGSCYWCWPEDAPPESPPRPWHWHGHRHPSPSRSPLSRAWLSPAIAAIVDGGGGASYRGPEYLVREALADACDRLGVDDEDLTDAGSARHVADVVGDAYDRFLRLARLCGWRRATLHRRAASLGACLRATLAANNVDACRDSESVAEAMHVPHKAFLHAERDMMRKLKLPTLFAWPHALVEYVGLAIGLHHGLTRAAKHLATRMELVYFGHSPEEVIFAVFLAMWRCVEERGERLEEAFRRAWFCPPMRSNPINIAAAAQVLNIHSAPAGIDVPLDAVERAMVAAVEDGGRLRRRRLPARAADGER
jgi:hypothetical protein